MYHGHFKGTHFQSGYLYGIKLLKNNFKISNQPTFSINQSKKEFALKCLPIYQHFYPEIIEEIKGLANGQQIDFEDILTFLLSMYCFEFENKCTCIAISNHDNIILGRNSDFVSSLKKLTMNCIYKLDNTYAFTGNTTAFIQMEDGVNEYGLACGLTFIYPETIAPGLNAGMLIRYILEKCQTVTQAINFLKEVPIASNQIITLADSKGRIVVVECNCQNVLVIDSSNHYLVATNHFNLPSMQLYNNNNIDNLASDKRYLNANQALANHQLSKELIKDILSGKHGFMWQYSRKSGVDTIWSVIYDLKNKQIERVEGNPGQKKYLNDNRFKF